MIAKTDPITAARAAALFVSGISATVHPTRAEAEAAIRDSLRTHGGGRGCAADVAAAYGDYPELAGPLARRPPCAPAPVRAGPRARRPPCAGPRARRPPCAPAPVRAGPRAP